MSAAAPPRRALVIANPISGQNRGESVGRELKAGLELRGLPTDLHLTTSGEDTRDAARRLAEGTDLVVSVGGDGTLREVLSGLRQRGPASPEVLVGLLPMGTGNCLAVDLGLPLDVDGAIEVLLAGRTAALDVADVNGALSFLIVGVGPDAEVVEEVHRRRSGHRLSRWAYVPAALQVFRRLRGEALVVELDGERLPGTYAQVMASNLVHYGGLVRVSPERVLDDGLLEVFLFPVANRWGLALQALRFMLGKAPGGPILLRRAARIRVTSASPVPYHVDGDPMGRTPVEIAVTGERFHLLVP
jgi:diacylglycerol kinase (ATP)